MNSVKNPVRLIRMTKELLNKKTDEELWDAEATEEYLTEGLGIPQLLPCQVALIASRLYNPIKRSKDNNVYFYESREDNKYQGIYIAAEKRVDLITRYNPNFGEAEIYDVINMLSYENSYKNDFAQRIPELYEDYYMHRKIALRNGTFSLNTGKIEPFLKDDYLFQKVVWTYIDDKTYAEYKKSNECAKWIDAIGSYAFEWFVGDIEVESIYGFLAMCMAKRRLPDIRYEMTGNAWKNTIMNNCKAVITVFLAMCLSSDVVCVEDKYSADCDNICSAYDMDIVLDFRMGNLSEDVLYDIYEALIIVSDMWNGINYRDIIDSVQFAIRHILDNVVVQRKARGE